MALSSGHRGRCRSRNTRLQHLLVAACAAGRYHAEPSLTPPHGRTFSPARDASVRADQGSGLAGRAPSLCRPRRMLSSLRQTVPFRNPGPIRCDRGKAPAGQENKKPRGRKAPGSILHDLFDRTNLPGALLWGTAVFETHDYQPIHHRYLLCGYIYTLFSEMQAKTTEICKFS